MYYVRIETLNGRRDFYDLIRELELHGYGDRVGYYAGDSSISSHLQFIEEGDVVAYCLTYGCTYSTIVPTQC